VCASELARLTDRQSGLEATNLRLQRELDLSKTKAEDLKSLKRERDRLSADVTSFREENDGLKAQVAALVRGGTAGWRLLVADRWGGLRPQQRDLNQFSEKYPAAVAELDDLRKKWVPLLPWSPARVFLSPQ
jgi:hypothetical protein